MAGYVSEHTLFMQEWMKKNPDEVKQQEAGRNLWWDKPPLSADEASRLNAAKVPSQAYYYDPYSKLGD